MHESRKKSVSLVWFGWVLKLKQMKVGLFIPCYINAVYPEVGRASYELLRKVGCEVDYPLDQTCCGQPMANAGFEKDAKALAERISSAPVNDPMAESDADNGSDAVQQAADTRSNELKDLLVQLPEDEEHAADNPYQLMADLGTVMERAVAVRCDEQGIEQALTALHDEFAPRAEALHAHSDSPTFNQEITAIWEVRHLLELGKAVLTSSDARHESRGSLKRLDFPERDDEHFLAHSMVNASGQISWQPVHIVNMPPKAREY